MISTGKRKARGLFFFALMLAVQAPLTAAGAASGSLAGSKGDVRRDVAFPMGATGGCIKRFESYVAARGHSAYASTPMYNRDGYHCAAALNAKSQKAAEEAAIRLCNDAKKRWKPKTGPCEIMMSK